MDEIEDLIEELEYHTLFDTELDYEIDQNEQLTDFQGEYQCLQRNQN